MFAGDFCARKENLIKACMRGVISHNAYLNGMHNLFVECQVSAYDDDDVADSMLEMEVERIG